MSEPTLERLWYLRRLAVQVGEKVRRPRPSAKAWREIARMQVNAEFVRRVRDCLAEDGPLAEGGRDVACRHDNPFYPSPERSSWTGAWVIRRWCT